VIGQVAQTYIIAEGTAGLYLVDQHAAHERVLHEDLELAQLGGGASQLLLEPIPHEVDAASAALVEARIDDLRASGFDLEPFGPTSILIRGVPVVARGRDPLALTADVLGALVESGPQPDWREQIRVVASCKAAVRAGDSLNPREMGALLERLGEKDLCRTCSHGRPTALLLSHRQLEQEFGRR
jgi:DNA mismatch repair protein MutL